MLCLVCGPKAQPTVRDRHEGPEAYAQGRARTLRGDTRPPTTGPGKTPEPAGSDL